MTSFVSSLWHRLKTAITGEATTVEATLTRFEQDNLPKALKLLHQIEQTIGQQGITLLEQGLMDIETVAAAGGNIGLALQQLIPQVLAQVKTDLKLDAKNAAYGAAAMVLASLPAATGS